MFSSNNAFAALSGSAVFGTPGLSEAVQTITNALREKNTGDTQLAAQNGARQLLPLIEALQKLEA